MNQIQLIATTLHLLLCDKQHVSSMEEYAKEETKLGKCSFYLERQLSECWNLPIHHVWTTKAEEVLMLSGLEATKMIDLLQKLMGIISQLDFLNRQYPQLKEFIEEVILKSRAKTFKIVK